MTTTTTLRTFDGKSIIASDTNEDADGIEHKHIIEDTKGNRWLLKYCNPDNEISAARIAKLIGARTAITTLVVDGAKLCDSRFCSNRAVAIKWLDDAMGGWNYISQHGKPISMRVLDYIIQNTDRHNGNFLVSKGRLVAIDHGLTFGGRGYNGTDNARSLARIISGSRDKSRWLAKLTLLLTKDFNLTNEKWEEIAKSRIQTLLDYIRNPYAYGMVEQEYEFTFDVQDIDQLNEDRDEDDYDEDDENCADCGERYSCCANDHECNESAKFGDTSDIFENNENSTFIVCQKCGHRLAATNRFGRSSAHIICQWCKSNRRFVFTHRTIKVAVWNATNRTFGF